MSLHDPATYARIVRSFIDIQQHEGWLPECRGATVQQFIQGGSSGDPILAEFYIKYAVQVFYEGVVNLNIIFRYKDHLHNFGIDDASLYAALIQDAEVESPSWDMMGRQANAWKDFGENLTVSPGPWTLILTDWQDSYRWTCTHKEERTRAMSRGRWRCVPFSDHRMSFPRANNSPVRV